MLLKRGKSNCAYSFYEQIKKKTTTYLSKSNLALLKCGKNAPSDLVLFSNYEKFSFFSTSNKSITSESLSLTPSAVSDIVALIPISPFTSKLFVRSLKAQYLFDVNRFIYRLHLHLTHLLVLQMF